MKMFATFLGTLILTVSVGTAVAGTDNTPPKGSENAPGVVEAANKAGAVSPKQTESTKQKGQQCDGPQKQIKEQTER